MAKSSFAQTDFTGGEVSPFVYGRVDVQDYGRSLTLSKNGLALEQGLWVRRPGTQFAHFTKGTGSSASRLVSFEAAVDSAYVLEFGDQFIRAFNSPSSDRQWNSIAGFPLAISSITQANPVKITTSLAHGMSTGDPVYLHGAFANGSGDIRKQVSADLNVTEYSATISSSTSFTVGIDGSSSLITSFNTTNGFAIPMVQISTQYLIAEVPDIRYVQSVDVMYLVHTNHIPRTLSRTSSTFDTFAITDMDLLDGPYLDTNATATTLTPGATSGSTVSLVASAVTGINDGSGFASTDVGRLIRLLDSSGNWTWAEIVTFSSTTKVIVNIRGNDLGSTSAVTSWRLGLYSATTGYPKTAVFFDDRLWFGGCPAAPNRVDGSYVGAYATFSPTAVDGSVNDAHAVAAQLLSRENNQILWMTADDNGLILGTAKDIWTVQPAETGANISPTNINAKREVRRIGSADADVVESDAGIVFIGRSKRKLMLLKESGGKYETENIAVASHHLMAGGIEELAFQQDPIPIVWMRRNDGVLVGVTVQGDNIRGWHWHPIGGDQTALYSDVYGNDLPTKVTSLAVTQRADGLADQLWMVTNRDSVYSMEFMQEFFDADSADGDMFCIDWFQNGCQVGFGSTALAVSPHLEGKVVSIYEGTTFRGTATVVSGVVTIGFNVPGSVKLGFPFTSQGAMLRPDSGSGDGGPSLGKRRGVSQASMLFYRSADVQVGNYDTGKYRPASIDAVNVNGNQVSRTLFTGVHHMEIDKNWDRDGRISWKCDGAWPCNIQAVIGFIETTDLG